MPTPIPATTDPGLVGFIEQSPLLLGLVVTVVGGLILWAIVNGLGKIPALKPSFARAGKFFKRSRPIVTSEGRREDAIKQAKKDAVKTWTNRFRPHFEASRDIAQKNGEREGYKKGYDAREAEVAAERAKPVPLPRWGVRRTSDPEWFLLDNSGWQVKDVSLDALADEFVFLEKPEWDELGSNGAGSQGKQFKGTVQNKGRRFGVHFTVKWVDINGDWKDAPVVLDRETRRAVVL